MSGETFQQQVGRRLQRGTDRVQVFGIDAQPAHTGVHFQVHGKPGQTEAGGGLFQQLDLPRFPDRGRQLQANDFFFLAPPEPRHQEDASANARIAQGNRFIE